MIAVVPRDSFAEPRARRRLCAVRSFLSSLAREQPRENVNDPTDFGETFVRSMIPLIHVLEEVPTLFLLPDD